MSPERIRQCFPTAGFPSRHSLLAIALIIFAGTYIYHKKAAVKATKTYQKRKEKLLENKLKFLTDISHELKTPLTLIYSPLQRLLEKNTFEGDLQKELTRILSQSKYMNQLINTVLDSRKMEEGFGILNVASYDLRTWIKGICEEFRAEFENKSMTLEYDVSDSPDTLNFDGSKFKIILSNLLMNAWKYSDSGTGVCIRTSSADGMVRISVIDDRFTQSNRAAKGSTFWFEIPEGLPCQSGTVITCSNEENDNGSRASGKDTAADIGDRK